MYTTLIIIFHFHSKLICLPRNRVINNFGIHLKMCLRNIYLVLKYVCSCIKDVCNRLLDFFCCDQKTLQVNHCLLHFHNIVYIISNEWDSSIRGLLNINIWVCLEKKSYYIILSLVAFKRKFCNEAFEDWE